MQQHNRFARRARIVGTAAGAGVFASALVIAGAPGAQADLPDFNVITHGVPDLVDNFNGITAAPDGGTYAVGFQVASGTDRAVSLVKTKADGSLDTSFGTGGRATVNLVSSFHEAITANPGAKELGRGVAVDSLGRILVLGEVEGVQSNPVSAIDTDIFVARFHPTGALDTSYGNAGWMRLSLSDGVNPGGGAGVVDYAGFDIAVRPNNKAVFTVGVGTDSAGTRTSRDIGVAQLRANGGLDTSFGDGGVTTFDTGFSVNVRRGYLDSDGSWFMTGYANVGANNQPWIAKADANGNPDESWGSDGLATLYPGGLGGFAEAYGISKLPDGNYLVSAYGYRGGRTGAAAANGVDAILFSLKPDGTLNTAWGQNGLVTYHFGDDGNGSGDRHRDHVVLPDGRIVGVGGTQGTGDAILTVTSPDGSTGESTTIDLGGSNDHLWGMTTVGNGYQILAAGLGGDDSKIITLDLSPAASSTLLALAKSSVAFGAANSATISVQVGGAAAAGSVAVELDGQALETVSVGASGTATVALPRDLAVGSHELTATLAQSAGVASSTASATVQVTKAASKTTVKLSKATIKKGKQATATIKVTGTGVPAGTNATGTVTIFDGTKKIATVKLTAANKGTVKVKLPKLAVKNHTIKVNYAGDSKLKSSSAKATLKVVA